MPGKGNSAGGTGGAGAGVAKPARFGGPQAQAARARVPSFASGAQAEAWVKHAFPRLKTVALAGADPVLARGVAEALVRVRDAFPDAFRTLRGVGLGDHRDIARFQAYPFGDGTLAMTTRDGISGRTNISLNPAYWRSRAALREVVMRGHANLGDTYVRAFSTGGVPSGVVAHEFGHVLEYWLAEHKPDLSRRLRSVGHSYGDRVISGYSTSNDSERFAEGIGAMFAGDAAMRSALYVRELHAFLRPVMARDPWQA